MSYKTVNWIQKMIGLLQINLELLDAYVPGGNKVKIFHDNNDKYFV